MGGSELSLLRLGNIPRGVRAAEPNADLTEIASDMNVALRMSL
jgi:hypothetical protein